MFQNKSAFRALSKSMIKLFAKIVNGEKPLKAVRNLNAEIKYIISKLAK